MKHIIILLLTFCLPAGLVFSQNVQAIDSLFTALNKRDAFNGNLLLMQGEEMLLEKSMGMADFELGIPLNSQSVLEFASIGKIVTAISIGILHDQGKIDFDAPVLDYISAFPYPNISVRHLLNHTSGLPDYMAYFEKNGEAGKRYYNQDVLDYLINTQATLLFSPGTKYQYSNTGYVVLASLVERTSGYAFDDFVEKYIFEPLDIRQAIPYKFKYHKLLRIENYAYGYRQEEGSLIPFNKDFETEDVYQYGLRPIQGDGNIIGTLRDYAKIIQGLDQGKIVSPKCYTEFFKIPPHGGEPYGFGIFVSGDGNEFYHTGSVPGYQSYFKYIRDKKVLICYVRNVESWDWSWFQALDLYLGSDN